MQWASSTATKAGVRRASISGNRHGECLTRRGYTRPGSGGVRGGDDTGVLGELVSACNQGRPPTVIPLPERLEGG